MILSCRVPVVAYFWGVMEYTFEVKDEDLEDRKKIIRMKESLIEQIEGLSDFGRNTMISSLNRLVSDIHYCENEWLSCQREMAVNTLSVFLNVDRSDLNEKHW